MKVKSEMKHWKGWNIANKSTRSKSFSQGMPGGMSFTPIDTSKSWSYQCCLIESCFPRLHVHRCWRAFHTRMWKDEVLCVPLGYAGFYGSEKQTEGKMFFMRFAGCELVGSRRGVKNFFHNLKIDKFYVDELIFVPFPIKNSITTFSKI